jgi:glycerol-3-phosphate acyltransferase PlsY
MLVWVLLPVAAYLAGSIPFGPLLFRWRTSGDLRGLGSGNIGATNVFRQAGARLGLLTLAADLSKGALPVFMALCLSRSGPGRELLASVSGLAAFFGHLYPLYTLGRGGGKGVATAAGCALLFSVPGFLVSLVVFAAAVGISRRASVGSLAAAATLPAALFAWRAAPEFQVAGLIMGIFIWYRHKENLKRLANGSEPALFGK